MSNRHIIIALFISVFSNLLAEIPKDPLSEDASLQTRENNMTPLVDPVTGLPQNENHSEEETRVSPEENVEHYDIKGSPDNPKADIWLNFEKVSLAQVVNYLAEQKEINFIPNKEIQTPQVSLSTRNPLTLDQAWDVLYTLLESNGFTIIATNDFYRIVRMQDHQQKPLPLYSSAKGVTPDDLPDSDEIIRYIYFCQNIKSQMARGILEKMLSDRSIQTNPDLEACIITEKSLSIKAAMKIVSELDHGGLRENIRIHPLNHANAENIARIFNEQIIEKQQQQEKKITFVSSKQSKDIHYFSDDVRIIPEPTHNTLVMMGTNEDIEKIVSFIDKYLDVEIGKAESRVHVKELHFMAAEKMQALLTKLVASQNAKSDSKSAIEGEYKYFEDVTIVAETPQDSDKGTGGIGSGNRLIIACGNNDWIRLNHFIDKIDKASPQVAMEIMIVDLVVDDDRQLSTQLRSSDGTLGKNIGFRTAHALENKSASTMQPNLASINTELQQTGATLLNFGDASKGDVWGYLRAVYNINHSNIIAQPFLVSNNNTKCEEEITTELLVPGEIVYENGGQSRKLKEVKASIKTTITPRVNAFGTVNLDIQIIVEEFQSLSDTNPGRNQRRIETQATMAVGEVLVIGGLTNDKQSESEWKTPILANIPILGNLFKGRTQKNEKKNLYVFIRPSIIKPHFEGTADDYTQLKLDYAKYQILKNDQFLQHKSDPIQRWFFHPNDITIKQRLMDIAEGHLPVIDGFAQGKTSPKLVQISRDPYFKVKKDPRIKPRMVSFSEYRETDAKQEVANQLQTLSRRKGISSKNKTLATAENVNSEGINSA